MYNNHFQHIERMYDCLNCWNYDCPFLTSSSHCATVFPEAFSQKWTPRNWLWPNSLVFGWPHFWQNKCSGVRRFFGVRPCALTAAAASSAFLLRQAVVLGTLWSCGAGMGAAGTGATAGGGRSSGAAAGTGIGAAVDIGSREGAAARTRCLACPEPSSLMANSKAECPCLSGSGIFDSTGGRSSEATNGAAKGSMFCCSTSLSCLFFRELCLCTNKDND